MKIFEINWKQSKEWTDAMGDAFETGLAGETYAVNRELRELSDDELTDLVNSLSDAEKEQLIILLQDQLSNSEEEEQLPYQKGADKIVSAIDAIGNGMQFAYGMLGGGSIDSMRPIELQNTHNLRTIIEKIEKDKPISEFDRRELVMLRRVIPQTPPYRKVREIVDSLVNGEQPSKVEIALFKKFINDSTPGSR